MMKKEFEKEDQLRQALDAYTVDIPKNRLAMKQSLPDRVLMYLFSPGKNPFDHVAASKNVFTSFKMMPLFVVFILSIIQTIYFVIKI